ncbi:ABSCISIC ACID-INSENSITIVE 5-like protein 2 isoform X2 [Cynara cardunculus var. scolymus]|uniref:ABSCISIC ACID-INSENSITIVE 5-like protein 2 isoform X2 n=1 Tax=Cynara cardunculus var. scolymus TaxID=59895 RepID=UPI000D630D73|nr:ABSCISIC ACID-INSENSITIVE 5-like protein 2 isoform X2 [Cynara cardunculus var. scolymus]
MGTRTMGSHGGGGGGNGGTQHPKSDGFSKQGPLYNLTLDEVQHQLGDLGKPLSSMNLDELLKSIWTAETEANEGMGSGAGPLYHSQHTQLASTSSMAHQSSLDLSRDLSKKTVDELWQDIQQGQKKKDDNGGNDHNLDRKAGRGKQPTLGEMTLEDFLAKAGIVSKSSQEKKNLASVLGADSSALAQQNISPQQAQWMQFQIPPIQQQHVFMPSHHQVQPPLPSSANQIMDPAYSETQMTMSPSPLMSTLSDTQTPGRKRVASGDVMEKTVERRQKRMIKNRESAARSRARKQAYTHELENKVSRLEEENERLKREKGL